MTFGEKIKMLREIRGMNMAEMARKLNMPYTTYRNYEKGREPKMATIRRIAKSLDVLPEDLISDELQLKRSIQFFMPMIPPTVTAQEHAVRVVNGKPVFYDPPKLNTAKQKLIANLAGHIPDSPIETGCRLIVKWLFPITGNHRDGEYKYTKPDTDNLQKMLKDCMTECGFWRDDALVASEIIEKFWAEHPGIWICIEEL